MGKGCITRKSRAPSIHSRASRRATSPGIDTDKSLKNVKPPSQSVDHRPAVLAAYHSSGVTKKTKRKTVLSAKARQRQEKAVGRAEAVAARTALKVQKSKAHAKVIQHRRKAWEEVAKATDGKDTGDRALKKKKTRVIAGGLELEPAEEEEGVDEAKETPFAVEAQGVPSFSVLQPADVLEEEEIL